MIKGEQILLTKKGGGHNVDKFFQTLAVIRRNYLWESGVVSRLCKAAENEISNIVTLLLGGRAPGIDLGFAAMQCP